MVAWGPSGLCSRAWSTEGELVPAGISSPFPRCTTSECSAPSPEDADKPVPTPGLLWEVKTWPAPAGHLGQHTAVIQAVSQRVTLGLPSLATWRAGHVLCFRVLDVVQSRGCGGQRSPDPAGEGPARRPACRGGVPALGAEEVRLSGCPARPPFPWAAQRRPETQLRSVAAPPLAAGARRSQRSRLVLPPVSDADCPAEAALGRAPGT